MLWGLSNTPNGRGSGGTLWQSAAEIHRSQVGIAADQTSLLHHLISPADSKNQATSKIRWQTHWERVKKALNHTLCKCRDTSLRYHRHEAVHKQEQWNHKIKNNISRTPFQPMSLPGKKIWNNLFFPPIHQISLHDRKDTSSREQEANRQVRKHITSSCCFLRWTHPV